MSNGKEIINRTEQLEARIRQLEEELLLYKNSGNESRLRRAEIASRSGNWELHLDSGKIFGSNGALMLYGMKNPEMDYEIIKTIPYVTLLSLAHQQTSAMLYNNISEIPFSRHLLLRLHRQQALLILLVSDARFNKNT